MKGTTLAETILALLLVSLLVVFVATLFPGSITTIQYGAERFQADGWAQTLVEEQMQAPFSELTAGKRETLSATLDGRSYQALLEILEGDSARMRRIRATVTWESRGRERKVVHETWRTEVTR